ncbi:hypothetical protein VCB98_13475 [Gammaproteobacteria bacterium AB-CW1]|uniref:Uncharacterized protein n=1 Tax=Natronospira elongata TaxID=3110268 RepID=A0AAP6MN13_9GAMM|nr:hypothetical protein [Gammaproteobacteria bacterium AB-CW1]
MPVVFSLDGAPGGLFLIVLAIFLAFGMVPFMACLISDYAARTALWLLAVFYTIASLATVSLLIYLFPNPTIAPFLVGALVIFALVAGTAIWSLRTSDDSMEAES